jgi:HemY protein
VLQVQTARKSWEAAALTLDQQGRNGLLPKGAAAKKRAAMLTAEAIAAESNDSARAMELASKALDLDPALVPAAAIVARNHIASNSTRRAMKVLRNAWNLSPHPELAELIMRADAAGNADAGFERVRDTVGAAADNIENAVALAQAAIAARRFDVAREALSTYVDDHPQARVCALMAQIEDSSDDKGRVKEWLARALHAPRDPMWVSDGVANTRWVAVSPVTGEIVPCEWKTPYEAPQGSISFKTETTTDKPLLEASKDITTATPATLMPPRADDPGVYADD